MSSQKEISNFPTYHEPDVLSALSILAAASAPTVEAKTEPEGSEKTLASSAIVRIPPTLTMAAKSVFAPGKTYRVRLTRSALIASSGSGSLQLASAVDVLSMTNGSSFATLFGECRLRATRIKVSFFSNGTSPQISGYCSAFDPSNISNAPSFAGAANIPGAKLWSNFQTAGEHRNSWKSRTPRPWSRTNATVSGVDPVGGMAGTWYHSLSKATTASVDVATYIIECDYEFRNPQ